MKCELLICEDNCIMECDTLHSRRFTNISEDLAGSVPKNGVGMSLEIPLEVLKLEAACSSDNSVEIPTKCSFVIELLFESLLKAQHVSSGIPLIIRSSKLYLPPLVYIPMW
jgi:hypothetical protein